MEDHWQPKPLHGDDVHLSATEAGLPEFEHRADHIRTIWSRAQLESEVQPNHQQRDDGEGVMEFSRSHKILHGIKSFPSKVVKVLNGVVSRTHDMIDLWHEVSVDLHDKERHPELELDAELRRNNALSEAEMAAVSARKKHIITTTALQRFLHLPLDTEIHEDDIPVIVVGGSGGGYRACLGYLALIEGMQDESDGLWELVFYAAGVSGSCWSLAGMYTIGKGTAAHTLYHFSETSAHHPLSPHAIETVARSEHGIYFQLGPIVQKMKFNKVEWTPLDLYATLTTTHILLSRDPLIPPQNDESGSHDSSKSGRHQRRLNKAWFKWSAVAQTMGVDEGLQPIPIFTACRHERPWKDWTSKTDPFDDVDQASREHDRSDAWWQWFEFSPYEVGSDELEGWVPLWAFGRTFDKGRSDPGQRAPERSLSLLLGLCTSAPAGPLSSWIDTIARSLPHNSWGKRLKSWGTDWAKAHPHAEEKLVNHHPIHAVNEPNPFYGAEKQVGRGQGFENSPRVHLVDAGMSNNLPTHIFSRPNRTVDIALLGDYSSDVQNGAALERIHAGGLQRGLDIQPRAKLPQLPPLPNADPAHATKEKVSNSMTAEQISERFAGRYAQVLDSTPIGSQLLAEWRHRKAEGKLEKWELDDFKVGSDGFIYNDKHVPLAAHSSTMVYLPLLPNAVQPDYDPATAAFSSSYNLKWTGDQVRTIQRTGKADLASSIYFRSIV